MKDYRLAEVGAARIGFRYRSHRDGKEHLMRLSREEFIARVLWHVPPKGRHTVRYYGLYVPNAHGKRNLARDALGYLPETPARREQAERTCPRCGHRLWLLGRHHGEISINRSRVVQQGVQAAASAPETHLESLSGQPPPSYFLTPGGSLTQRYVLANDHYRPSATSRFGVSERPLHTDSGYSNEFGD